MIILNILRKLTGITLLLMIPVICAFAAPILLTIPFIGIGSLFFQEIPRWYILLSLLPASFGMYLGMKAGGAIIDSDMFKKIFLLENLEIDSDNYPDWHV